jgi:hypothetical protein
MNVDVFIEIDAGGSLTGRACLTKAGEAPASKTSNHWYPLGTRPVSARVALLVNQHGSWIMRMSMITPSSGARPTLH